MLIRAYRCSLASGEDFRGLKVGRYRAGHRVRSELWVHDWWMARDHDWTGAWNTRNTIAVTGNCEGDLKMGEYQAGHGERREPEGM